MDLTHRADKEGMGLFLGVKSNRPDDPDRRIANRLIMEGLRCDRGRVADLSKTGAKLVTHWPWKDGAVRPLTLVGHDVTVTVQARCVWAVKEGIFHHTVGVHFVDPTDAQCRKIGVMASMFAVRMMSLGYRERPAA